MFEIAVILVGFLVLGKIVRRVVSQVTRDRADPALERRVAELEAEVDRLRLTGERVAELEERLDFTERMLTRQQVRELPGRQA